MEERNYLNDYDELSSSIGLAQYTVYKKYLSDLSLLPVVQPSQAFLDEDAQNCIRMVKLEKLSHKKGEDIFQKLTTVYHASMSLGCSLIVMVDVDRIGAPAKIYIGVRNNGFDKQEKTNLGISFSTLKSGLKSNFPGTNFNDIPSKEVLSGVVEEIFGESAKYISSVSCIASRRDKSKTEDKTFVQGIERLIDAMEGNTYTAVFIAKPISSAEQNLIREGYESIYSSLSAFRRSTWTYSSSESNSVMESLSRGMSKAITTGTSHTQSYTKSAGANIGINSAQNSSTTHSHTESEGTSSPTTVARIGRAMSGVSGVCGLVGNIVTPFNPAIGQALKAATWALSATGGALSGDTKNNSVADTIANSVGRSLGVSGGLSFGYSDTKAETVINTETKTNSETKTVANTNTSSTGKSLQIENINKPIDDMLIRIDDLLKRTQECEDYGAFDCAVYFISGKQASCMLGANTYRALMIGEGTSLESGAINFWNGEKEPEKLEVIKQYIKRFEHPLFAMPISEKIDQDGDFVKYTAGTIVSGLELPLHMGLPSRTVYGLPVIEHANFGKEVVSYKKESYELECEIGNIFSMGITTNTEVKLDINSLAMHTFITGTTGSGKSNTIYWLLEQLIKENKTFLVIEPAKGEYKKMIGQNDNVTVYGTNPLKADSKLLKINPFSFPVGEVHILEHLDRLVEIFNVCWPMYAAMPAILKDSIERAYISAGWDLIKSSNKYSDKLFPTFSDVMLQIKQVLNESEYSNDNKQDYIGSLVTRIKSLTNGINGIIFQSDEISPENLFEENVVVDLSRVGSSETKALIMGILVLKLQEHRMLNSKPDSELSHVTVLEEAHNLLKRASTEQINENSNLLGKSVEMLSNAIAEMRTYGEGFIIADQAPALLDMSVIRNTNTKIIMRLPDYEDRVLVGKSAGLNDEQIDELSKLEMGVASISQSTWLEPVLCKISNFKEKGDLLRAKREDIKIYPLEGKNFENTKRILMDILMEKEIYRKCDRTDVDELGKNIISSDLDAPVKCEFLDYLYQSEENALDSLRKLVYDFFDAAKAFEKNENTTSNLQEWVTEIVSDLHPSVKNYSNQSINLVLSLILYEQARRNVQYRPQLLKFTEEYMLKGRVI